MHNAVHFGYFGSHFLNRAGAALCPIPEPVNKARIIQHGPPKTGGFGASCGEVILDLAYELGHHHVPHDVGLIPHCKEDLSYLRRMGLCRITPTWTPGR